MKTINKFMMVIVAVVMVIGFSAFKAFDNNHVNDNWYYTDENGILQPLFGGPQEDCDPDLVDGIECAVQTYEEVAPNTLRSSLMPFEIQKIAKHDEN